MEQIDIIPLIKREIKKKKIRPVELARGLQIQHSAVYSMLERNTLQVQRLVELSVLLQHNFFSEIAELIPGINVDYPLANSEAASLQERVKELEIEVKILRQTIKDLAGK